MDPTLIEAGVALIGQIVQLIEPAKAAKTEQHADIVARLQAARAALGDAQATAHKACGDEVAADVAALAASKR